MGMAPFQSRAQTVTLSGRDESVSEGSALWEEKDNCCRGPCHKRTTDFHFQNGTHAVTADTIVCCPTPRHAPSALRSNRFAIEMHFSAARNVETRACSRPQVSE